MEKPKFLSISEEDISEDGKSISLEKIIHLYYYRENEFMTDIHTNISNELTWIDEKLKIKIKNISNKPFNNIQKKILITHLNDLAKLYSSYEKNYTDEVEITEHAGEIIGMTGDTIKVLQGYYGVLARTEYSFVKTTLHIKAYEPEGYFKFKNDLTMFMNNTRLLQEFVNNLKQNNIAIFGDLDTIVSYVKKNINVDAKINCDNLLKLIQQGRNISYSSFSSIYNNTNPIWDHLKTSSDGCVIDNCYGVDNNNTEVIVLRKLEAYLENKDNNPSSVVLIIGNKNCCSEFFKNIMNIAHKRSIKVEFWFWRLPFTKRTYGILNSSFSENIVFKYLNIFEPLLIFFVKEKVKKDDQIETNDLDNRSECNFSILSEDFINYEINSNKRDSSIILDSLISPSNNFLLDDEKSFYSDGSSASASPYAFTSAYDIYNVSNTSNSNSNIIKKSVAIGNTIDDIIDDFTSVSSISYISSAKAKASPKANASANANSGSSKGKTTINSKQMTNNNSPKGNSNVKIGGSNFKGDGSSVNTKTTATVGTQTDRTDKINYYPNKMSKPVYLPIDIKNAQALALCKIGITKIDNNSNEAIECFNASIIFVKNTSENIEFQANDMAIILSLIGYVNFKNKNFKDAFNNYDECFRILNSTTPEKDITSIIKISEVLMGFYCGTSENTNRQLTFYMQVKNIILSVLNKEPLIKEKENVEDKNEICNSVAIDLYNFLSKKENYRMRMNNMNSFYLEYPNYSKLKKKFTFIDVCNCENGIGKLTIINNDNCNDKYIVAIIEGVNDY